MKTAAAPSGSFSIRRALSSVRILFLLIAASVSGCSGGSSKTDAAVGASKPPCRVHAYTVRVEQTPRVVTLSGFTEPLSRTSASARVMAEVLEANFKEGDRVERGRVLVRLDTRDLQERLRQAKAGLETAVKTLEVAKTNLGRMRELYKSTTVSLSQLETTEVAYSQANSAVLTARATLDELDVNLSYTVVRAPYAGVIVRKMTEVGNMVTPGQPLFIIEDDSRLRIVASVGADLSAGLTPGQVLQVQLGGSTVRGTIEGVVSSGDTRSPGLRTQLLIDNPGMQFKPGTLAVVEVPLQQNDVPRITVPKNVLVERGRLTGVYVIGKGSVAGFRWIITGESHSDTVSVLTGLNDGDRVVCSPVRSGITDGRPVEEIR
jgi:RND family efflux transporter MFP subunit